MERPSLMFWDVVQGVWTAMLPFCKQTLLKGAVQLAWKGGPLGPQVQGKYRVCCRGVLLLCLPSEGPVHCKCGLQGFGIDLLHQLALAACPAFPLLSVWHFTGPAFSRRCAPLSAVCDVSAEVGTWMYGVRLMLCKGSVSEPIFAGFWPSRVHALCLGLKMWAGRWVGEEIRGTSPH